MSAEMQIDGQPASAADLGHFVLSNYGAFTSMQVEDGGVRGLDLHLARLEAEAVELFGVAVPEPTLRQRMRQALDGRSGRFSLRVNLFSDAVSLRAPEAAVEPRVLTTLSPPASPLTTLLRLQSQAYAREVAHLKHAATFGLTRARRQAILAGFDDALFVDGEGPGAAVSEGSFWNIGFWDGDQVVWPQAPALRGTSERLLQQGLAQAGIAQVVRPVARAGLGDFLAAFATNANGVQPVASIDRIGYAAAAQDAVLALLADAGGRVPWEPL